MVWNHAVDSVTVSPKYQVVIPQRIRDALGLTPGVNEDRIEFIPVRTARSMRGMLKGIDTDVPRDDDRV